MPVVAAHVGSLKTGEFVHDDRRGHFVSGIFFRRNRGIHAALHRRLLKNDRGESGEKMGSKRGRNGVGSGTVF
jgi:hypothetical protein